MVTGFPLYAFGVWNW